MSVKISRKDILWNYGGNILNIGMGILLLPIVLHTLSSQELGLWYVFGSISGLVTLVDSGFCPTIMRNITYCWCGATELLPEGVSQVDVEGKPNYSLLKSVIEASKKIYLMLALIAGALLISIGTFYIYQLSPEKESKYLIAWLIYAFAVFLSLYYNHWFPLLRGIGAIKEANHVMIITKIIDIVFSTIGLLLGGGLIWLSIMFLISGILVRILSKVYFSKLVGSEYLDQKVDNRYNFQKIFRTIWPNSKKNAIVTFGTWLMTGSTTLLCSTYMGLSTTSQYGLSLQLLGTIGNFSSLLLKSYIPEITYWGIRHNVKRYNQIISRVMAFQWLLGIIGIMGLVLVGPICLKLTGSNATLLPSDILTLLGIVLFLEWNHSSFQTLITLSNTIPFMRASIYSGIGIMVLSLTFFNFSELGILGLVISRGIVQLSYNNWYWPRQVLRENQSSVLKILKTSFEETNHFCKMKLTKNIQHN